MRFERGQLYHCSVQIWDPARWMQVSKWRKILWCKIKLLKATNMVQVETDILRCHFGSNQGCPVLRKDAFIWLEAQISSLWREWSWQQASFSNPVQGELFAKEGGDRNLPSGWKEAPFKDNAAQSKLAAHMCPHYSSLWGFCSSSHLLLRFTENNVRTDSLASPLCSWTRETYFTVTSWRNKVPKALNRPAKLLPLYPDTESIWQLLDVLPGWLPVREPHHSWSGTLGIPWRLSTLW